MPDADRLAAGLSLPRAAIVQGDVTQGDLILTELARYQRPAVLWWWGIRRRDRASAYARCYLCDRIIATWSSLYPPTVQAVARIVAHRDRAHGPAADTGTPAGSTMGPADAPEERSAP